MALPPDGLNRWEGASSGATEVQPEAPIARGQIHSIKSERRARR